MPRKSISSQTSTDLPWTSTRCLRLLRPLITRFHALRVLHEEVNSSNVKGFAGTNRSPKRKSRYGKTEDAQDTEWDCYRPSKRARKTYSSRPTSTKTKHNYRRHGHSSTATTAPSQLGMLSVPTPYLNKTLARDATSTDENISLNAEHQRTPKTPSFDTTKHDFRRGTLMKQLYRDFDKVIEYTTSEQKDARTDSAHVGAPSLFSMCLRNVPTYITNEEEWQKEDEDDEAQINIMAHTYNQLEDFGQGQEGGWKHLKSVLQAHAVHILQNAIAANYLQNQAMFFAARCWKSGLQNEAWSLLACAARARQHSYPALGSSISATHPGAVEPCFRASRTTNLAKTESHCDPHDLLHCARYFYLSRRHECNTDLTRMRATSLLLESPQFPPEWLSCSCYSRTWQDVIQSLSNNQSNSPETLTYTLQYLLRSGGISSEQALDQPATTLQSYKSPIILEASIRTLTSLCAMLATMALVDLAAHNTPEDTESASFRLLRMAAIEVNQAEKDELEDLDQQAILARMSVLMTDVIVMARSGDCEPSLLRHRLNMINALNTVLAEQDGSESLGIEHLSKQLCSASKCYARATSKPDIDLLSRVLDELVDYQNTHRRNSRFVRRIILDTAIMFAQENPSTAANAYVHTLETSLSHFAKPKQPAANAVLQSSPATAGRPGFRWEQGICEWVASTPASLLQLKRSIVPASEDFQAGAAVANTPCAKVGKRWVEPSQVFVGVVVPECTVPDQPSPSKRCDAGLVAPDMVNNAKFTFERPTFEDSGVFMGSDEVECGSTMSAGDQRTQSPEMMQAGIVVNADKELSTSPSPSTSPAQPGLTQAAPRKCQIRDPMPSSGRTTRSLHRPPPSLPINSHKPTKHLPHRQQRQAASKKIQLLQEDDDSEDELSINESDCCAGATERGGGGRSASVESSLLGARVVPQTARLGSDGARLGRTRRRMGC